MSTFTENGLKTVISKYVQDVLEEDEKRRIQTAPGEEDVENVQLALITALEDDSSALVVNDLRRVEDAADVLLMDAGIALEKGDFEYKRFCRELLKARIEVHKTILKRTDGDYSVPAPLGDATAQDAIESPLLSEIIEEYITDREGTSWTPRSAKMARSGLQQFLEYVGDQPIHELTKANVKAYRDALQRMPKNAGVRYPGKTMIEVLEMELEAELSVASINKLVGYVCSMCNYAINMEYIDKNPASGLKLKEGKAADNKRWVFTTEQFQTIFNGDYLKLKETAPERFWIPLIMLCMGTRLEEAAQLLVKDVISVGDILCISINADGDDKSLKTRESKRVVPVHPMLLDLGFEEYLRTAREKGEEARLFPKLVKAWNGYGNAISKWFNSRLRKLGITDRHIVLYSTRHTLIDTLKNADVQAFTISEIAGHKVNSITVGRYGKKLEPKKLLEALSKADFRDALSNLQ